MFPELILIWPLAEHHIKRLFYYYEINLSRNTNYYAQEISLLFSFELKSTYHLCTYIIQLFEAVIPD